MAKLQQLPRRGQTVGSRVQVLVPSQADATPRERGRRWMRRRAIWLHEHPLCCVCDAAGLVVAAAVVDHRVPLWRGGADDESNYQSLCVADHDVKTAREAAERGNCAAMR